MENRRRWGGGCRELESGSRWGGGGVFFIERGEQKLVGAESGYLD